MIPIYVFFAALLAFFIHEAFTKQPRTFASVVTNLLMYILVFNVGVMGLLAFVSHTTYAAQTAEQIGWQPGSPFQTEIAMANLAFGVLGILCLFFRQGFWLATGLGYTVFVLGAAYVHIQQIKLGDEAPYNSGIFLWGGDVGIPILILVLLGIYSLFTFPRTR